MDIFSTKIFLQNACIHQVSIITFENQTGQFIQFWKQLVTNIQFSIETEQLNLYKVTEIDQLRITMARFYQHNFTVKQEKMKRQF